MIIMHLFSFHEREVFYKSYRSTSSHTTYNSHHIDCQPYPHNRECLVTQPTPVHREFQLQNSYYSSFQQTNRIVHQVNNSVAPGWQQPPVAAQYDSFLQTDSPHDNNAAVSLTVTEESLSSLTSCQVDAILKQSQNTNDIFPSFMDNSSTWHSSHNPSNKLKAYSVFSKNVCPICGKSYARPSTLKTHMRIHSGERPFQCNVCNKSFSQAANLTAHLRVHSGEKPFSCTICHKTFSQSSSVTTHMRTHSGDRPYKCPICRKGFSDSSTLTKHLRIHSGEKPYCCTFCSMSFSQSGNLNRHMKIHEPQRNDRDCAVVSTHMTSNIYQR